MVKRKYNIRKTISMKKFISEYGDNFSDHMKKRLMELEIRCVLTRKEIEYKFDIKHVEHTLYNCNVTTKNGLDTRKKEYVYGQLLVVDGVLYFSEKLMEDVNVMMSPVASTIYNSLSSEDMIMDDGNNVKKVDDSNIDFVIDTMLTVFPQVSQSYLKIMSKY